MNVKPDFSKGVSHAQTAPAFLSVWDMHAYYGESYIVQGISFNVHEGEILALLGRKVLVDVFLGERRLILGMLLDYGRNLSFQWTERRAPERLAPRIDIHAA